MAEIVKLPMLNKMDQLCCDECEETALNLFFSKDGLLSPIAYRCITCNFIGYYSIETEDEVA